MTPHQSIRPSTALAALGLMAALLVACSGGSSAADTTTTTGTDTDTGTTDTTTNATTGTNPTGQDVGSTATDAARLAVGDLLFHDTRLSAAGNLACASCHVQARGHADAAGVFLPLGGPALDQPGLRSSPTLDSLNSNRAFAFDSQGLPSGGFTWDGRAGSRADQALGPLLAANEMAHASSAAVVARVRTLPSVGQLLAASGLDTTASDAQLLQALLQALQADQAGDPDYQRFTSWRTRCRSTPPGTWTPRAGTRWPTAWSRRSTTCLWPAAAMSSSSRRSACSPASRRG